MTFRSITKATLALALLMATCLVFAQNDDSGGGGTSTNAKPVGDGNLIGEPGGAATSSPVIGGRDPGDVDLVIDISGFNSWDALNAAINETLDVNLGAESKMTGIGWDVTLSTNSPSWLSEAAILFSTDVSPGVFLTPGTGDNMSGTMSYSSGGIIDLSDNGIPDIQVDGNNKIDAQFYETFDDVPGAIDATWTSGTITIRYTPGITVPTLGQYGMLAMILTLVGLGLFQIRRQKALS